MTQTTHYSISKPPSTWSELHPGKGPEEMVAEALDNVDAALYTSGGGTTVLTVSISTVLTQAAVSVKATAGVGGITITLPSATAGQSVKVKKMDSALGAVTISGGTIDGASSYLLVNRYQYVVLEFDGTAWDVMGGN